MRSTWTRPRPRGMQAGERSTQQLGARMLGDAPGLGERGFLQRGAAHEQHGRLAVAQQGGGGLDDRGGNAWGGCGCGGLRDHAAFFPGGIGGQDQCGDLAGIDARRLDGGGGIGPNLGGAERSVHKGGNRVGEAFDIGGQRGIQRAMVVGLVADNVHDGGAGALCVVQVGDAVRKAGAAMQQGGGGFAGDAVIGVGGTGDDGFIQTQHAMHSGDSVQRCNEMHLAGAGIGKNRIDPGI